MKFAIRGRWSSAVKFEAEIEADENTPLGIRIGLAVKWAYRSGADLRDADLRGAVLRDAVLRGAVLSGADLSDADLRDADLRDAVLSGADLSDADLRDADLRDAVLRDAVLRGADLSGAEVPFIPALDTKILAAIVAGGSLEMGSWHTCETTHCRAGWAIHLAGEAGTKLEAKLGSAGAGALIYAKAYPELRIPNFYDSNERALADIRARAAADPVEARV